MRLVGIIMFVAALLAIGYALTTRPVDPLVGCEYRGDGSCRP